MGSTSNLKERLKLHNFGSVTSTKAYKLWVIIYYEAHRTKKLALKAELFYKGSQERRHVKKKLGIE